MHQTSQQFNGANEVGIQAFERLAGIAFAGAERLAALNLNTARNLLEQGAATSRALLDAKDPEALVTLQTRRSRTDTREAAEYSRRVVEIATQTGATVSKLVETGVSGDFGPTGGQTTVGGASLFSIAMNFFSSARFSKTIAL